MPTAAHACPQVHRLLTENERLRKRLAKAEVKLGQTRAALDIMGKAFALLEMLSEVNIHLCGVGDV